MSLDVQVMVWIVVGILSLICVVLTVGNGVMLTQCLLYGKRGSAIPVLGGLSGMVALLIAPIENAWIWCWVPIVVDYGSAPLIVTTLVFLIRRPA